MNHQHRQHVYGLFAALHDNKYEYTDANRQQTIDDIQYANHDTQYGYHIGHAYVQRQPYHAANTWYDADDGDAGLRIDMMNNAP